MRALPVVAVVGTAVAGMPAANADNRRLNDGVVANVYTVQHRAGVPPKSRSILSFVLLPSGTPTTY